MIHTQLAGNLRNDAQKRTLELSELHIAGEAAGPNATDDDDLAQGPGSTKICRVSIGLKRTTTENTIKIHMQKLEDASKNMDDEYSSLTCKLKEAYLKPGDDILVGGPLEVQQDLQRAINNAKLDIDRMSKEVYAPMMEAAKAAESLFQLRVCSLEALKAFHDHKNDQVMRTCRDLICKTKRLVTTEQKKRLCAERKADHHNTSAVQPAMPPSPMASILTGLADMWGPDSEHNNVSTSLFEAKMGHRAARVKAKLRKDGAPISEEIRKNQYVKTLSKQARTHLTTQTASVHVTVIMRDVAKLKRVEKLIREGFDAHCSSKLLLPEEEWADHVYNPQVYSTTSGFATVFTTNNGTIEARLILAGEEILVGVPYEGCPGTTFRDKRHFIGQLDVDKLATLVTDTKGFCVRLSEAENENLIILPSGFILLSGSKGCTSLRWGVASDDRDTARVLAMGERVIASFQEYNNASQPIGRLVHFLTNEKGAV